MARWREFLKRRYKLDAGAAFVLGLGTAIFLVVAVASTGSYGWRLCQGDENWITCGREWADVLAVIGTVATILILLGQQRLQRETAVLQTLDVRSKMVEAGRTLTWLHSAAESLQKTAMVWRIRQEISPATFSRDLLQLSLILRTEHWERIASFSQTTMDRTDALSENVNVLIDRLYGSNSSYARNAPLHAEPSNYVDTKWRERIEPSDLHDLAQELFRFHGMTSELIDAVRRFDVSDYFAAEINREEINRRSFRKGRP